LEPVHVPRDGGQSQASHHERPWSGRRGPSPQGGSSPGWDAGIAGARPRERRSVRPV